MVDLLSLEAESKAFSNSPILSALWDDARANLKRKQIYVLNPDSKSFLGLTWSQYLTQILNLAKRMQSLGIRSQDKILIHSKNSLEWDLIEKACFLLNLNLAAIEPHVSVETVTDIFLKFQPRMVFSDSKEMFEGLMKRLNLDLSQIYFSFRDINTFDSDLNSTPWSPLFSDGNSIDAGQLILEGSAQAICYTLFTSGSTGQPKCVNYTQKQILETCLAILNHEGGWQQQQRILSWLPMANLFQRITNLCALLNASKIYFFHPPTEVLKALKIVRPSIFVAVPRFYDKIYEGFLRVRKKISWAPSSLQRFALRFLFWRLFSSNVILYSGSAALRRQTQEFFEWLGFPILEAYGLTECILPVAMNTPKSRRSGSVGKPLLGNSLSFTENWEICIKSEFASSAAVEPGGILHTGDIGFIDRDGFLHLKDRLSKIIKLSTGRKIYREVIENNFYFDENIDHFLIFGNEKPYLVGLITLNHGFVPNPSWMDQLSAYINKMNSKLNESEKVRSYRVIPRALSMANQELTANLKVKYPIVEKAFQAEINQQYPPIENS